VPPRKPLRLPHYDYASPGAYFVTICTHGRACLFGSINGSEAALSYEGGIVRKVWSGLPAHYPNVALDEFVIMPNHVHGILVIHDEGGRPLSEMVRGFKAFSTRELQSNGLTRTPVWQRGYYEHVVRDDDDLTAIREYIRNNPLKWELDEENPERRR
jgi:REP element-mobilizing transposase RayT